MTVNEGDEPPGAGGFAVSGPCANPTKQMPPSSHVANAGGIFLRGDRRSRTERCAAITSTSVAGAAKARVMVMPVLTASRLCLSLLLHVIRISVQICSLV